MPEDRILRFGRSEYLLSAACPENREQAFYDMLLSPESLRQHKLETGELRAGRGSTVFFRWEKQDLVLRHYRRGGMMGRLTADRFFFWESMRGRAFAEFRLLRSLSDEGLPVPRPFLCRQTNYGLYTINDIILEQIRGAENLAQILAVRPLHPDEWQRIGSAVSRLFAAGVFHADLNLRNILIAPNGEVYIIDFDKCFRLKTLTQQRCEDMLDRLERSFLKEIRKRNPQAFYEPAGFARMRSSVLVQTGHRC